jgi:hypothetical protein
VRRFSGPLQARQTVATALGTTITLTEAARGRRRSKEVDVEEHVRKATSWRRWFAAAGLLGVGLLAGGILAGAQIAGAAGSNGTSSGNSSSAAVAQNASGARMDPATVAHGPGETLLTDGAASKVTAAAKAAVPGATIIRVETDSGNAAYEAHMRKADGTYVTVKFDRDFKVIDTVSGFGGGPHGPGGPQSGSNGSQNGSTTGA